VCNRYVPVTCTTWFSKLVGQFKGVIEIYPRPTLVAMVMKISEFEHKVANYTVRTRVKSNILQPSGDIQCR